MSCGLPTKGNLQFGTKKSCATAFGANAPPRRITAQIGEPGLPLLLVLSALDGRSRTQVLILESLNSTEEHQEILHASEDGEDHASRSTSGMRGGLCRSPDQRVVEAAAQLNGVLR